MKGLLVGGWRQILKKAVGRLGGLNHDVDQNLPPNV